MRMALAENGVLSGIEKVSTEKDPATALAQLLAFAHGKGVQDAVGGIAGISKDGTVLDSPNLRSWEGVPLGRLLEEALSVPVQIYNDAELAGMGEALAGAGQGYIRVAYLAIGTGVGGALIVREESGLRVAGSEPGRLVLDSMSGQTLEDVVGGSSLASGFGVRAEDLAQSVYDERTPMLANGIRSLIDLWAPDVFVLNGPLIYGTPAFRMDVLSDMLSSDPARFTPPIVQARFMDESGLWGGALV